MLGGLDRGRGGGKSLASFDEYRRAELEAEGFGTNREGNSLLEYETLASRFATRGGGAPAGVGPDDGPGGRGRRAACDLFSGPSTVSDGVFVDEIDDARETARVSHARATTRAAL